jgi:hypothetical protein
MLQSRGSARQRHQEHGFALAVGVVEALAANAEDYRLVSTPSGSSIVSSLSISLLR